MRVLVLLVALAGPVLSQFLDYKLQAADDSGRYISDESGRYIPDDSGKYIPDNSGQYIYDHSGDYIHQPGPDGPDYKGEAATNVGISILPENNFLIPNPPLNPRTYLPPVSAGPVRSQPLPPLELPLPPAFPTRNGNPLNTPPSHLPIISLVGTPLTPPNSIPFEGKRNPPTQSVTIIGPSGPSRRQSPPNGGSNFRIPSLPAVRPSGGPPFGTQTNRGRPNIRSSSPNGSPVRPNRPSFGVQTGGGGSTTRISSPNGLNATPNRPLTGSRFVGKPNRQTSPALTSFGTGSRRPLIPSQSGGGFTTELGGSPAPRRTIKLSGPPPAEINASIKRPGIKGGGPYIWDYASTGPHVVDVIDPYHKYRVHFLL